MGALAAFFAKPAIKYGAIALAVLALVGGTLLIVNRIYSKGEKVGEATVTNAVQSKTIKEVEKARISKEKTDVEVQSTPYNDRVDGLR